MVAGGEDAWREDALRVALQLFSSSPPMKFATESCETMEACIRAGMPILLFVGGPSRGHGPCPHRKRHRAGGGRVPGGCGLRQFHRAGAPGGLRHMALRLGPADGRDVGRVRGNRPCSARACAQMHRFYGLPGGAAAGMTDAKVPDMQAGWEQGITNVMAGLSGLNMVYESVGMYASLLGFCPRGDGAGQRPDRAGAALRARDRRDRGCGVARRDEGGLPSTGGRGITFGSDQTLALMQDGVSLSRGRQPADAQGLGKRPGAPT